MINCTIREKERRRGRIRERMWRTFHSPGRMKGGAVDDVCDRWNMRFGVAVAYTDRQIGDQDTRVLVRKRKGGGG